MARLTIQMEHPPHVDQKRALITGIMGQDGSYLAAEGRTEQLVGMMVDADIARVGHGRSAVAPL